MAYFRKLDESRYNDEDSNMRPGGHFDEDSNSIVDLFKRDDGNTSRSPNKNGFSGIGTRHSMSNRVGAKNSKN